MTDNNIDEADAKYWCMFNDDAIRNLIKGLNNPDKAKAIFNNDIKKAEGTINEADFQGSMGNTAEVNKRIDKMVGKISSEDQKRLHDLYKRDRLAFNSDPIIMKRRETFQKLAQKDDETEGIFTIVDDDGTVKKLNKAQMEKNTTVLGFLENMKSDFMKNLNGIFSNILTGAVAAGAAYLLYKAAPYMIQKTKYMFKKMLAGNSLAECLFTTSDGTEYKFCFDIKVNKWILKYNSMKVMQEKSFPPRSEVDSFLQTEFCKKFVQQCKKILDPVFSCELLEESIKNSKVFGDGKQRDLALLILKNKKSIMSNMYNMKIRYED